MSTSEGSDSLPGSPLGRDGAHRLVDSISESHGYIPDEELNEIKPALRQRLIHAMLKKDEMIGSSVVTLSKNLYNSSARFVFELLQNADDNSYVTANRLSLVPFVSFRVYHRRIVMECNEDGFTPENLIAICNVGQSSKTGGAGYIGEKGIGFKSVFMVAWKVLIQSGDFSFYFQHRMGDSGFGMISPVWEEAVEELAHPLTRITLFLHDAGPEEILAKQRETTLQEFQELQATFLLFMKNLRRIQVQIYDEGEEEISSTTFSMRYEQQDRVQIKREVAERGKYQEQSQHYYVEKQLVSDLPKSENRTYTEAELSRRVYSRAEVILAFPTTHDSIPIVEPQEVFAFLPIRKMGFPFLMHSDFVTDASRQDVVRSSPRNVMILSAIGRIFVEAISQLIRIPTLRYTWMRYLPRADQGLNDPFWMNLLDPIRTILNETSTLYTKSGNRRRRIKNMRRLDSRMLDKERQPLLPDLDPEQYLASQYLESDLDLLRLYGLRSMDTGEFLDRLNKDVEEEDTSVMQSPDTEDDWHSRVAKILISSWPKYRDKIEELELIPLADGGWTAAYTAGLGSVYYCNVSGYRIPSGLNLKLVDGRAEKNRHRKEFLDLLGVREPNVSDIRRAIVDYHKKNQLLKYTSRRLLTFLYLTAHLDVDNDNAHVYRDIAVTDHMSRSAAPATLTFFFADDDESKEDPFSAQKLLEDASSRRSHSNTSSLDVRFLDSYYMVDYPSKPEKEKRTWKKWLSDMLLIRYTIPLTHAGHLSKECLHVAEHHPEKFLCFLSRYWKSGGSKIACNEALIKELRGVMVLCEGGNMYPLGETYVHDNRLDYANKFLLGDEKFPWLKLDPSLNNSNTPPLKDMTNALGFGYPTSELHFYLTILRFIMKATAEDDDNLTHEDRVYELYNRIETRCNESVTPAISREEIRKAFTSDCLIYVPAHGDKSACWTDSAACVWEGPDYMRSYIPLKPRYDTIKGTKYTADLFRDTLAIRNADLDDFLVELRDYYDWYGFGEIYDLYQQINMRRSNMDSGTVDKVRALFESDLLVYHGANGSFDWYRPSDCIWSSVTNINGLVSLNEIYEDLEDFFVDFLGVRTLTLDMVLDKLVQQGEAQSSIKDVKETIWLLNSYLQTEEHLPSSEALLAANVFPVKYASGAVQLCSFDTEFAVADRQASSNWFRGRAKLLDFDVNDIPKLEPFLQWSGLEARYLSSCIKEISTLTGGPHNILTSPDRNIASKAHGLLRIAVHFRSPRARQDEKSFYELLKRIHVYETDGISSELHLSQDGKDIKVEVSKSELHLYETKGELTIYMPRNQQAQYLCFLDRLPSELLQWIMTEPSTGIREPTSEKAINMMQRILQAQKAYVSLTLDRAGILSVNIPDDTTDEDPEIVAPINQTEFPEYAEDGVIQAPNQGDEVNSDEETTSSTLYETSTATYDVEQDSSAFRSASGVREATSNQTIHRTPFPHIRPPLRLEATDLRVNLEYRRLLYNVVHVARQTAFPSRGLFDMLTPSRSLDSQATDTSSNRSSHFHTLEKVERDKMIGAAGELFVFEVLSCLSPPLPGFSRSNWQSTIRNYVTLQEDYADMQPWNGRETADITYDDANSVLTSLLIAKGYLNPIVWADRRPKYYIEVKTTTSACETPFYMSKHQYARMQDISLPGSRDFSFHSIYVIMRVFNLGQDSAGFRVYLQPELMREKGQLKFTAETWSVVPTNSI